MTDREYNEMNVGGLITKLSDLDKVQVGEINKINEIKNKTLSDLSFMDLHFLINMKTKYKVEIIHA